MAPTWTDIVQAVSSGCAVFVALVGFLVIRRQITQVERGIRGETHVGLYQHNFEVMKFVAEHPKLRPYFYDGAELKNEDPEYPLIITTAGMFAALFEHVALQKDNLPLHVWNSWVEDIKDKYERSPALRQYYQEHPEWYSSEMLALIGINTTALEPSG